MATKPLVTSKKDPKPEPRVNYNLEEYNEQMAIGSLYQLLGVSASLAISNATANQQRLNVISIANTTACVNHLLGENKNNTKK